MTDKLCKDNIICCDDNCQRCANLIYNKYMEQKAEIKRLKRIAEVKQKNTRTIKSEAIKEFAERLKEELRLSTGNNGGFVPSMIDNLVKEMVGDNNG